VEAGRSQYHRRDGTGTSIEAQEVLDPELIGGVTVRSDYLSAMELYRYITYQQENSLASGHCARLALTNASSLSP